MDLSFPSLFYPPYANFIFKTGFKFTIAELITVSASWPGASGLNIRELTENTAPLQKMPSFGLGVNFNLPSGNSQNQSRRQAADGLLQIDSAIKPLYDNAYAIGAGVTWHVGRADNKPPVLEIDYPEPKYFSPNHDGKNDYLLVPVRITDDNYVVSWEMKIIDEDGNTVRVIENTVRGYDSFSMGRRGTRGLINLPTTIRWDGLNNSGELAKDGNYYFTISVADDSGNVTVSPVMKAILKNSPPEIYIEPMTIARRIFDPGSTQAMGNRNNSIVIVQTGSWEDAWESGIYNSAGEIIRTFETETGKPSIRIWDGRDNNGQIAPDGVYSYRISAADRAGNYAEAVVENIILTAGHSAVIMTSSVNSIAPQPLSSGGEAGKGLVDFVVHLAAPGNINYWTLDIKDEDGTIIRRISGNGDIPPAISWSGLDEQGMVREGKFTPEITITYRDGSSVSTTSSPITVDVSGPRLSLTYTPEYFSPDNDGNDDELFISITAEDESPISRWSLEIREPETPFLLFRLIEGRGTPADQIIWDGKSDKGELVQSATYYQYVFTAEDIHGNTSSIEGRIGIGILVLRDGDRLKIQIPSIIFRGDHADFVGLSSEIVENNYRIMQNLAQILNNYRSYRILVEGHANPTQPYGPAREREEPELRSLSDERARVVVDLLTGYGVSRNRMFANGAGASRPVVAYEDHDNWWKNRRVEFYLTR